jgi:hypothetical protein
MKLSYLFGSVILIVGEDVSPVAHLVSVERESVNVTQTRLKQNRQNCHKF